MASNRSGVAAIQAVIEIDCRTLPGTDVPTMTTELRRRIGYVFQSGGLFPHISVAGNIGITPKLQGTLRAARIAAWAITSRPL